MRHAARAVVILLPMVAFPAAAGAQARAGGEFHVNEATALGTYQHEIASSGDGGFVVVWMASGKTGYSDVVAKRYDARGSTLGAEFQVNSHTGEAVGGYIGLDADRQGNFVVAWGGLYPGGYALDVLARRFDKGGTPLGSDLLVNTYTSGTEGPQDIAVAPDGAFIVTWISVSDDSTSDSHARRFDPRGSALGDEFLVSEVTTAGQSIPVVGLAADHSFFTAYTGYNAAHELGAFCRRWSAEAQPLGAEFRVNTPSVLNAGAVTVKAVPEGSFLTSWSQFVSPTSPAVFVRRFAADGTPGPVVRADGGGFSFGATTATDASGRFVVAWSSNLDEGSDYGIRARRFSALGVPLGPEFKVNTYTTGRQYFPVVASDRVGNFTVAWVNLDDDLAPELRAQRFGGLLPAALAVDDGADGVLDPSDTFTLRTSWRNVNGAAQTFSSASSDAAAPGGLQLILSAAADYGTVADGVVGQCATCFSGSLGGTRPAGHVDAGFRETIAPLEQGQVQAWTLHVGRSFADVAGGSPFYRFIETLLHHSVTGGCSGNAYCPAASTTREQMAVFLLAAKEGAGYAPPACTTPVFADVPASSPFCRFIEELARRGVTSGCGGGNYCPGDAVTREQMAVFVLRTLDPALDPPACTTPVFNDVPASSPFCRWVEELARRGVTSGCGGGSYCPAQPIPREQMAVFLTATFGLTLYGP